eukprot:CAMPEP_0171103160 /NCGR_PEP_ID=MMETSP0766_2-20121228/58770_1 /TAXON_ID=439317 /ORGANISM="Gambierdiscus australes, Strain CAWD 149" /LENGTH=99 /DNA_ID=CAMNT_0011563569 /DNA_START=251 /DNA_END=546 /DNA_ORIENTATION=-
MAHGLLQLAELLLVLSLLSADLDLLVLALRLREARELVGLSLLLLAELLQLSLLPLHDLALARAPLLAAGRGALTLVASSAKQPGGLQPDKQATLRLSP